MSEMFREEWKRLQRVDGVFWGPHAPYQRTPHSRDFAPLDDYVDDSPVAGSPDSFEQNRWLPNRRFVFSGGVARIHAAKEKGDDAIRDVLLDETGIDLDTAFKELLGENVVKDNRIPSLTATFGADAFGTYLPWHAYGDSHTTPWGIYIFFDRVIDWTAHVWRSTKSLPKGTTPIAVFNFLFNVVLRHELFHYHVERFATRLEVLDRRPVYRPYVEQVQWSVASTSKWLEEALAQAVVLNSTLLSRRTGFSKPRARKILVPIFKTFGPGYRDFECAAFGGPEVAHTIFAAQIARAKLEVEPGTEATSFSTPLREYSSSSFEPPGFLVWNPHLASRFQLATPKDHQFRRFAKTAGLRYQGPGPGDHHVWHVDGKKVQVNYVRGHLDIASVKAVAKVLGLSVGQLCQRMTAA